MFHHHRSFFPLVLALLTILLIALMIWKLQPEPLMPEPQAEAPPEQTTPTPEPVSAAAYQDQLADLLGEFFQRYDAADQGFLRVIVADETLSALLDLRVPTEYKDLHLAVAMSLNTIRRGLTDEPELLEEGLNNLQDLRQEHSWLP